MKTWQVLLIAFVGLMACYMLAQSLGISNGWRFTAVATLFYVWGYVVRSIGG